MDAEATLKQLLDAVWRDNKCRSPGKFTRWTMKKGRISVQAFDSFDLFYEPGSEPYKKQIPKKRIGKGRRDQW